MGPLDVDSEGRIICPVIRRDLDPVRMAACSARNVLAEQQAAFGDPLRVDCETCGAKAPHGCVRASCDTE